MTDLKKLDRYIQSVCSKQGDIESILGHLKMSLYIAKKNNKYLQLCHSSCIYCTSKNYIQKCPMNHLVYDILSTLNTNYHLTRQESIQRLFDDMYLQYISKRDLEKIDI